MLPLVSETIPDRSARSCESKRAYRRIDAEYRTLFAVRTKEPDTISTACGRANCNRSCLSFCVIPDIRMAAPALNFFRAHRNVYCMTYLPGKHMFFLSSSMCEFNTFTITESERHSWTIIATFPSSHNILDPGFTEAGRWG